MGLFYSQFRWLAFALVMTITGVTFIASAQSLYSSPQPAKTPQTPAKYRISQDGKIVLPQGEKTISIQDFKRINLDLQNYKKTPTKKEMSQRSQGGDVSGGGTSILINGERRLLDIARSQSVAEKISYQEFSANDKIKKIVFQETNLDKYIQQALTRTSSASVELAELLTSLYQVTPFYLAHGSFKLVDTNLALSAELNLPNTSVLTTAFNIKNLGILIASDSFLEMNAFHQSGLVIHELLRTLQIHLKIHLSNSEIQNLTASILDSQSDLSALLATTPLRTFSKENNFEAVHNKLNMLKARAVKKYKISAHTETQTDIQTEAQKNLSVNFENSQKWFALANEASAISASILEYVTLQQSSLNHQDLANLEKISDELDLITVQARAEAVQNLSSKALSAMSDLNGSLLSPQRQFISDCSFPDQADPVCSELRTVLKALID